MKTLIKKLINLILTACIGICFLLEPAYAFAQNLNEQTQNNLTSAIGMHVSVSGQNIGMNTIGGTEYLFLPSNADKKKLVFVFNEEKYTVSLVKDDKVSPITSDTPSDISSFLGDDCGNGSRKIVVRLSDAAGTNKDFELAIMQSANIGSMYLTSSNPNEARQFVEASKSNKAKGSMNLLTSKGAVVYSGELSQIKGRGNTTFNASKKPYQIKLDSATDLLQTGNSANASKTWILLANAYDPTLIHNTMAFKLAKSMGVNCPDYAPIDLYYDGQYRGNYLLCEKVEVGSGRVEINDLAKKTEKANDGKDLDKHEVKIATNKYGDTISYVSGITNPEDITGGYLLEQDNAYYKGERSYFVLSNGTPIVVKSPENCSKEQVEYISCYMEEMLQAAQNGGINPENNKSVWEYIDKNSLAKYFIHQQVVKNADAFVSSTYLYKDSGDSVLIAGPAWDYDDSYGIREDVSGIDGIVGAAGWIAPFINIPEFRSAVKSYYSQSGYSKATNLNISGLVSEISASEKMNRILWNNAEQMYTKLESYDADTAYLKTYANDRAKWLKSEFAAW